jgi:DnaJ-class molecular chaperone
MARSETPAEEDVDEVFGTAIDTAVRRAVDRVGREPLLLEPSDRDDYAEFGEHPSAEPHRRRRLEDHLDDPDPVRDGKVPLPQGRLDGINPYAVLGVSKSASWEQITAAYKRRARAWHPDGADPEEAERRGELIRQLNVAYALVRKRRHRSLH